MTIFSISALAFSIAINALNPLEDQASLAFLNHII